MRRRSHPTKAAAPRSRCVGAETVDYRLVRARRRTIGMEVDLDGLTVRAPRWVTISRDRSGADRARALDRQNARRMARAGGARCMPREWKIRRADPLSRPRARARGASASRAPRSRADLFHLTVLHPARRTTRRRSRSSSARGCATRRGALVAPRSRALRRPDRSRAAAGAAVERAQRMGKLQRKGEIRLNWRLVQLPPALAEYVVAHEVAHLVELNHSRALLGARRDAAARVTRRCGASSRTGRRCSPRERDATGAGSDGRARAPRPPATCRSRVELAASSSPPRVSRQRPSSAESESRRSARRPRSRDWERGG